MSNRQQRPRVSSGFTLVELLIVIGIIALLVGILIPVIGKARRAAYAARTKNFLSQLSGAIERYQGDFRAYPGPLANNEIWQPVANQQAGMTTFGAPIRVQASQGGTTYEVSQTAPLLFSPSITMSENLVLGLLGGLRVDITTSPQQLYYDPSIVGLGAQSLNSANPKRYAPYLDANTQLSWRQDSSNLKTGQFQDDIGLAIADSLIPEFVDNFPDPMPVLYFRAKAGVPIVPTTATNYGTAYNSVITNDPNFTTGRPGAYDLSQNIAYTACYNSGVIETQPATAAPAAGAMTIGVGKRGPSHYYFAGMEVPAPSGPYHGLRAVTVTATGSMSPTYSYPLDAFPYFQNPATVGTARQKDSYILISAGIDRIYGTDDDIVSFGTVGE